MFEIHQFAMILVIEVLKMPPDGRNTPDQSLKGWSPTFVSVVILGKVFLKVCCSFGSLQKHVWVG